MAREVKIASVQFITRAEPGRLDAREIILRETAEALDRLRGYRLDLVVLCESIGAFAQRPEDAEEIARPGPLLDLYARFAASERCYVAGPLKLADGGRVYNSLAFVGPSGEVLGAYHKVNLTLWEIEEGLCSGERAVVVDTPIGRLGGVICFDLNFEGLRAEYRALKPDILAFASMYHGGLLQQMWAYDCRCYFVSALPIPGGGILDPLGRPVALTHGYASVAMATVNLDRVMVHLDYNQPKLAEIEKKYVDEVRIDVPPYLGVALITSLTPQRTALDIAHEFGLELLDEYLARAQQANAQNRRPDFGRNP